MDRRIDLVGYLHIGYGALTLLIATIALIAISAGGLLSGEAKIFAITSGVAIVIFSILAVLALPSFIGGFGLLKRKPWSRILVIILSALHLLSFPFGTLVGGYSLYILMQDNVREELEGGGFSRIGDI
jgi:hypothetical protein